ncbi:MAG: 3-isopropylmalate dehydratase large subunit [Verrucomicrobiota bacterium]
MPQTLTEKVMARAASRDHVQPGENVWVNVDVLMTHDVCGPGTIGIFKQEFGENARVFDADKVVVAPDHYIFTEDEKCHRNVDTCRAFAREQNLLHFYDPADESYSGVCHMTLAQKGHCRPGEVLLGTDSHTCSSGAFGEFATGIGNTDAAFAMGTGKLLLRVPETLKFVFEGELPPHLMAKDLILHAIGEIGFDGATYCAMQFEGDTIATLNMDERITLCNMAIEAGGKNGIIAPDDTTIAYVRERTDKPFQCLYADPDATYKSVHTFKTPALEPVVALPHSPDNRALVRECADWTVDRAYIGSCTGGKITDFRAAARILKGNTVAVDTFVVPATVEIDRQLDTETIDGTPLRKIFEEAGCLPPAPPSCAACLGGPVDTFGRANNDEVVVSTTNRNFVGRMGSKSASVILASPLTAAASAITGHLTDPRDFL